MTRTELFAHKRKGIAKAEYIFIERLNNLSDKLDEVIETQNKLSEYLYELAKQPKEIFKEDVDKYSECLDKHFKESLREYEKWIGSIE